MTDTITDTKTLPPLRPRRHRPDLFTLDIQSISLKDTHQHLEHPFFVLDTRPDTATRHYSDDRGNELTITPSGLGMPTIFDKDILIYAISNILDAKNRGEPVSRRVFIYTSQLLRFANKGTGGKDYERMDKAIQRLRGCTIRTNIRSGDIVQTEIFGMLDSASLERKYDPKGNLMHCEITLSEWLWNAIQANQILTLHPDYFRIRSSLNRRIYEIARKHCGHQQSWTISLKRLRHKCASHSKLALFRHKIRKLAELDPLPEYALQHDSESDVVEFSYRDWREDAEPAMAAGAPDAVTCRQAEKIAPPNDIKQLHHAWLQWRAQNSLPPPWHPRAAFLGFVRAYAQRTSIAAAEDRPPPEAGDEAINPDALAWWHRLPDDTRDDLEHKYCTFRVQGEDYPRTEKQMIETAHRRHGHAPSP